MFGQRREGSHILEMIIGSKKPEASGNKGPTDFETILILDKISDNQSGEEKLSVRAKFGDMGLATIAADDEGVKNRLEHAETVLYVESIRAHGRHKETNNKKLRKTYWPRRPASYS